MAIILIIIFVVSAYILYTTIGFVEMFKHAWRASVSVAIICLIFIIPLGICYFCIGVIHVLLGRVKA